ncbi:hypothetical protein [Streptomyces sp. NPDC086023]|uniref:hypothetical protein n=1 Tax=Streptomyces sp. NPDC086023 TaxID=3365746 RepID=UPI0037CDCEA7
MRSPYGTKLWLRPLPRSGAWVAGGALASLGLVLVGLVALWRVPPVWRMRLMLRVRLVSAARPPRLSRFRLVVGAGAVAMTAGRGGRECRTASRRARFGWA